MPLSPSIFEYSQVGFSNYILSCLGKGAVHAALLYSEWYRKGTAQGQDPAFRNAQGLLNSILQIVDFTLPASALTLDQEETKKFLLRTHDGFETESVVIPMQFGYTLCVSSQVGCRMGCAFCETGRMGRLRNLTTAEIVSQLYYAKFSLGVEIRNIVFMGMGEPLDNYETVMKAIEIFTDPAGFGLGKSHITLSTSGLVDQIYRLIEDADPAINLAISVNAADDQTRTRLMPVNRKHNMAALYEAMKAYSANPRRQILIEYVMIQGENDSLDDADRLATYLRGLNVKINLIPYNPQSHFKYQPPGIEQLQAFASRLQEKGYYTLWRQPKGRDIMAACGQLGNVGLRKRQREKSDVNSK